MSDEGADSAPEEEETLVIPPLEARVPSEWQSKMSTKALSSVSPMETPELVLTCSQILEAKVKAGTGGDAPSSILDFVWYWLEQKHGSHKLAEASLASIISGVESSWQQNEVARVFGELCGILKDEYSESVTRRVVGLLQDEAGEEGSGGVALIPPDTVSATLVGEGDAGTVLLSTVLAALPRLQLPAERVRAIEEELRMAGTADAEPRVRLDGALLAALGACRAELGEPGPQSVNPPEELTAEQRAAAEAAAAEAAAGDAPAEVVSDEAGSSSAAAGGVAWEALAAKLPTTRPELSACHALFALFDGEAAGHLSREQLQAGVLETLGLKPPDTPVFETSDTEAATTATVTAVGNGFDAAKAGAAAEDGGEGGAEGGGEGGEGGGEGAADKLFIDEFRPLLIYVRRYLELLATVPEAWRPDATVGADDLARLAPRLARWGVADPSGIFANMDDGSGRVGFAALTDWALKQVLAEPNDGGGGGGGGGGGASEVVEGLEGGDGDGGGRMALSTVPETTEKSSFSVTQASDGGGLLGGGGLGSVQLGFFDASKLSDLDAPTPEPEAERPMPADFDAAIVEVETLRAELRAARGSQDKLREVHATKMATLMRQNDALQSQLRDLNAQVERVLQREIKRHRPGGGAAGGSPSMANLSPVKGQPNRPRLPKVGTAGKGGPPAAFFDGGGGGAH